MYGTFPGIALIFHFIISVLLIVGSFVWLFSVALTALIFYLLKIIVMLMFQKELKAFKNMRSTQETDEFLQGLR